MNFPHSCLYRLCREAVLEKAKENKNFWLELWREQLYMKQLLRGDYRPKIRKPVIEAQCSHRHSIGDDIV